MTDEEKERRFQACVTVAAEVLPQPMWSDAYCRENATEMLLRIGLPDLLDAADRCAEHDRRLAEITAFQAKRRAEEDANGCSFCGKVRAQCAKIVSGPKVRICDECVRLCVEIVDDEARAE